VGFLLSRPGWDGATGRAMQAAARQADISLLGPPLESPIHAGEYRRVLEAMAQEHVDGLIVSDAQDNFNFRRVIVQLAEKLRLPTVYPYRAYFELGGLMVYGSDVAALYRRAANYADQILRGRKPGDLPIYMESKYELLLNLKMAKALGLTFPLSLLGRADEVIE
jgi:putative ABC transport system substrate-binding protein